MKTFKRYSILTMALVLGLALARVSYAAANIPQDEERGRPHEKKIDKVLEQMGLSQEQKGRIKEFQKLNREKTKQLVGILKEKRRELGSELDKPNSDLRKIKMLTGELKDAQGRLVEQRVQSALELKQILTPAQYQQFSDSVKKFHKDGFRFKKEMSQ